MHFYSNAHIDRAAHRREDAEWLRKALSDPGAVVVPVWKSKSLLSETEPLRAVVLAGTAELVARGNPFFLGVASDGRPCFVLGVRGDDEPLERLGVQDAQFVDLRTIGTALGREDAGLLALARALLHWHDTNRYCGACGTATAVSQAGWLRTCKNPECGRQHFPRTDPAIIVRVEHGDRILLGRQAAWPAHWFSVLAGFVEPGESLEETVRREVFEEAGIRVGSVCYDSSQPWPFPASLMVGFVAQAESDEIEIGSDELEEARWFSRQEIVEAVEAGEIRLSPLSSISRHLIDRWLDSGS